jgi:uncharacterized protein (DUF433 family)/DNA-binding transcriptional MerR regulator
MRKMVANQARLRGHYLAQEVGGLAGVSGKRVGQWARRGYIRSSHSSSIPRIYSYLDVAEAMVVHELEDRAVAPKDIGAIVKDLRDELGTEWPLQQTRLMAPPRQAGKRTRSIATEGNGVLRDLIRRHPIIGKLDLIDIASNLERGGWAARDLPNLKHIEVNPDLLSGRPAIRGRRISAKDVALEAAQPDGLIELHEGYGLTDAEIFDARQWWHQVQLYEVAA